MTVAIVGYRIRRIINWRCLGVSWCLTIAFTTRDTLL